MSYPKCPHCSHQFDAEEIYYCGKTNFPTSEDGEETNTHCLNCEAELLISLSLEPSWRFLDDDGEEL